MSDYTRAALMLPAIRKPSNSWLTGLRQRQS